MESVKQQALNKMLKEMTKDHTPTEDVIHNWLCDQEDIELFEGIVKENKSISRAVNYCKSKARDLATDGSTMVDDKTVFGWVSEYFKRTEAVKEDIEESEYEEEISCEVSVSDIPKPKTTIRKKNVDIEQVSLFDL